MGGANRVEGSRFHANKPNPAAKKRYYISNRAGSHRLGAIFPPEIIEGLVKDLVWPTLSMSHGHANPTL